MLLLHVWNLFTFWMEMYFHFLRQNRQIQVSVVINLFNEFCLNAYISCWAFNLPSWRQHSVGSHLGVTFASARGASYFCKKVGHLNARAFSGFSKFTFGDSNWLFTSRSVNKSVCLSISWFFIMFDIVIVFCIADDCGHVPCLSIFRLEYGYARVDIEILYVDIKFWNEWNSWRMEISW